MAVKDAIIFGIIQHIETSPPLNNGSCVLGSHAPRHLHMTPGGNRTACSWSADSLDDAKTIESHSVQTKGMHSLSPGRIDSDKPVRMRIHPRF